jgi:hypothetical protein
MKQLNTPYPSTAYITGFLRSRGIDAHQDDLALCLVLSFFSKKAWLMKPVIFMRCNSTQKWHSPNIVDTFHNAI